MDDAPWTGVRIDARQLTVLAHPLRARLLAALRVDGAATATRLAERLGTNTGATSYHLRQLAEAGLVIEEDRPGSGKQRWWRAAQDRHSIVAGDFGPDDADAQAALEWLGEFYRTEHARWTARWRAEEREWPAEWRDAVTTNDYLLELTPEQVRALNREVDELMARYRSLPAEEGAETVIVFYENHPMPRDRR
ncbi:MULTISPECIES: winged helix-turn-helix domain-containing protein [Catenuloplanes]|uniref:ArsR family transcriptional regulator n=1 Tax=Catenuloplanes niger TaxID=587534 RepID=A0AAE3ZKM9_9ACTN|nr:winged helix-turn-helix domain-containing protein [Catenuloplanes niger]MDR7321694.1 putative ArsR family transcriptional regulator [Catenuloplanes niger]